MGSGAAHLMQMLIILERLKQRRPVEGEHTQESTLLVRDGQAVDALGGIDRTLRRHQRLTAR